MANAPLSLDASAQLGDDFSVHIGFEGDRVILGVRGDVDLLTAHTLDGMLRALVDEGHLDVVLDLGGLSFIDAAGLRAIANAAERAVQTRGVLSVRSAPPLALRILHVTRLSEVIRLETAAACVASLGAEQTADDHSATVRGESTDLARDLVRVGSIPASREVVDAALRLVTSLASTTVAGADGVSVTLERNGQLATVASTNDTVLRMDGHQYATGEGPCLAAAADGHWFHSESLAEESRWPAFVPRALEEGIASILSTPLMAASGPVGALNIYSNTERAFGTQQQELAALFATQASGILAGAGVDVTDEQMGSRILDALRTREVIAQAQGVYMARRHISAEAAAAALHRSARAGEVSVLTEAGAVLASTSQPTDPTT